VRFAKANRQGVRGHTLVWHNQLPNWLTQGVADGSIDGEELRCLLRKYVTEQVKHFKGHVYQWDVVNEVFNDDGTLRDSIWLRHLGPSYIADAFRWAHAADPRAKLYVNDYNVEGVNAKSTAYYELVKRLRAEGVPVHGFGAQGHLAVQYGLPTDAAANLKRFDELGVETSFTEVDVRMILPADRTKLARQAETYRLLLGACLATARCTSFTVWGFTDKFSWVPEWFEGEGAATLYDEAYAAKPAYCAAREELRAAGYGVKRFYADAWSAPGYMKTNGTDTHGGTLRAEWRRAYADYLLQYTKFYKQEGIGITDLSFTNEPDLATSYASMQFTPEQAVAMAKVLGTTLKGTGIGQVCCDATGWKQQEEYTKAIEADPEADKAVTTHAGHPYRNDSTSPLPTDNRVWMSEWSPDGNTWNENWDDTTTWDGIAVAEQIHRTLTDARANGYIYWFGASLGATRGLIQLDGANYHVSKRLWALAAYSRYIRPGATRMAATPPDPALKVSAYRNKDGSQVVEILNTGTADIDATFAVESGKSNGKVYRTDRNHSLTQVGTAEVDNDELRLRLPAWALTTIVLK
jgi:glucosylceramidase